MRQIVNVKFHNKIQQWSLVRQFKPANDFIIHKEKFDQYCKANKVAKRPMHVTVLSKREG